MGYEYALKETLLRIENVSLILSGKLILRDVNAIIKNIVRPGYSQGQVVGFLGPSGIGKTQLFRILAGLQEPASGVVYINESAEKVKKGMVGVVSQNYTLFEHRTVLGNLAVAARQTGIQWQEAQEKSLAMLERFRLSDKARAYPAELSGGQKQRIAIAQQLLCSEHFLLMDEPFSGLDPLMIENVCALISEVASADELNTIIVVTHDVESAVSVSDTLWLMGRDRDSEGNIIPGARIQETHNLIDLGLAWHKDIALTNEFAEFVGHIKERFRTL